MKLSEVKQALANMDVLTFQLPDGTEVPAHFHVTEIGHVTKHFIDCGGTVRHESVVNFQLWSSDDVHHRLGAQKLTSIIELSEKTLGIPDQEIEVEYQGNTIGKYGLSTDGERFFLTNRFTDCLAKESCGIPAEKPKLNMVDLTTPAGNSCTPGGGCC
ncbi:DUF6428 family protein [Pontibacter sp. G13]|uniref:DUF6428 family protein n=1 Tax=Pontibacter sp. G13 TaxID=3074898 RepID=UPI0028898B7D|nr:DUF6428 family protein [Pontibacter sp. G13]WNJ20443.1 DUF6428 family protein [Pontibacter sp. G13]